LSGSFLTKKEELSFSEADSQRRNPLGLSIKKYEYLWNSLYVKKYEYLWNRVVEINKNGKNMGLHTMKNFNEISQNILCSFTIKTTNYQSKYSPHNNL
jgi:hypothetical protein